MLKTEKISCVGSTAPPYVLLRQKKFTRDAAKIEQALKIKRKLEKALETNQV
jgi:hypothetical protein